MFCVAKMVQKMKSWILIIGLGQHQLRKLEECSLSGKPILEEHTFELSKVPPGRAEVDKAQGND